MRYSNRQLLLTTLGTCTHCVCVALDSEPRGCQWHFAMSASNDTLKGHVEMSVATSIGSRQVLNLSCQGLLTCLALLRAL